MFGNLLHTHTARLDILQPQRIGHTLNHGDLLANRVGSHKLHLGEENSKRNGGETTTATHIEHLGTRLELAHLSDSQRVQDMA